jgi:hypothetical protein
MSDNPIVEEVHRIRQQLLAEYNGDLRALVDDAHRRVEEIKAGRKQVVKLPTRAGTRRAPTKKAG